MHAAVTLALLGASHLAQAGYKEGMDALGVRDFAKARAEFEADAGNPKAQLELVRMLRQGIGGDRDDVRATALLRRAAESGTPEARIDLAFALGNGLGTSKDGAAAIALLKPLAEANHVEAMMTLGKALRYGWWGQPRDDAAGVALFKRAMDAGDAEGRLMVGVALVEGVGLAKDEAAGTRLIKEGADAGHLESQLEWARSLTFGIGVPKDEAAAVAIYRKAAERHHRIAQYNLGYALMTGRGVPAHERDAARFIDASARQGWPAAQFYLGEMFRNGWGVPKSIPEAYVWFSIAARSSNSGVAERGSVQRSIVSAELSEAQIARLQARADAFRPQVPFRARTEALPPLSRDDKMTVGPVTLKLPAPKGYVNGWQTIDWMQRAYPNDPELKPWLMVLNAQEDLDRMKLGLGRSFRTIEVSRYQSDDSIKVTPELFGEMKTQFRQLIDGYIQAGRYRSEGTAADDERSFAMVRAGLGEGARMDAIAIVLLKGQVLQLQFTGFGQDQKAELTALTKSVVDDLVSANKPGFFGN